MKMSKKLLGLGLAMVLAVGLVGCGSKKADDKEAAAGKLQQIKDSGTLVVGTSAEFPPFEFIKMIDGKQTFVGADMTLAKELADDMGVELEVKNMDFDALIPSLKSDKIDIVIAGMSPNEKRKKQVDFSEDYYAGKNVIVVNEADKDKFKNAKDLESAIVGVQKGSIQEVLGLEVVKSGEVKSYIGVPDEIQDLKNGKIQAVILNDSVAALNVKEHEGLLVEDISLGEGNEQESMAIAVNKGENKDLLALLNAKVKEVKDSGKFLEYIDIAAEKAASK